MEEMGSPFCGVGIWYCGTNPGGAVFVGKERQEGVEGEKGCLG
jgi:hypothetical protein